MPAGIARVLFISLAAAVLVATIGIALVGDLVMFSSHTAHDYDTTIGPVLRSPKGSCKNDVYFMDPVLQDSIDACVQHVDDAPPGMGVHVHALSGALGARILSVQRLSFE